MRPAAPLVRVPCALVALVAALALAAACGESRRPIGDECLRDDDCLSGVCANRACVSSPTLVTGAAGSPPDDAPRIPDDASSAPADAGGGG